ncbi:grpE protein homolog 2, mitochondrial-like [Leptonychotes weddellii]|uniref:GrpE protein homolog n=1 Tax=Leptonychotes weddellii TaxID=9713 RepID=A0A7F8QX71_LEPWE|nr:grpE protein homolog 2, mitochondrial-like [Leptonychotes weddellii]
MKCQYLVPIENVCLSKIKTYKNFQNVHNSVLKFLGSHHLSLSLVGFPVVCLPRETLVCQLGIQSFCKDLVEVADILEKTREYISEETEPGDQKLTLEKIFRGLSLLEAKLKSVFAKHGLEKMTPIGDKYDPHEHELLCHVPARVGVQPGTVALVRQDGYKLHGRTIRLARVEVAVESQRRL